MKPSETRPGSFGGRAPDVSIEARTRFQSASDADHGPEAYRDLHASQSFA